MGIDLREWDQHEHGKSVESSLAEPDNNTPEADIASAWLARHRYEREKLANERAQ